MTDTDHKLIAMAHTLRDLREKRDRRHHGSQQHAELQQQIDPLQREYDELVRRKYEGAPT